MTKEILEAHRAWVKAEVQAGIASSQPGSDGYFGAGYAENKEADRLFDALSDLINPPIHLLRDEAPK